MDERSTIGQWKRRARQLKVETYALYLAYRDPRVPWYAKLFVAGVVGYAFSPLDLIPDFVPVLGYLDDLVIVPLGVALALKMIPGTVLDECRERAQEILSQGKPTNWAAAGVIVVIWLLAIALVAVILARVWVEVAQ
jgi:uncharacterized membrane protein YkvA (DUF1232 family)